MSHHTRLAWALATSLLLHLAVLVQGAAPLHLQAPAASRLQARVNAVQSPIAAPLPAIPPGSSAESAPAEPPERTYPAAAPPMPMAEAASAVDGAPATAPPESPPINRAGLTEYHRTLSQAAARFRIYPPQAYRSGQQGRVILRLAVNADGTPQSLQVLQGSGYALLDQAAVDMMRLAASHTSVPAALQGQNFLIDLATDFSLTETLPESSAVPATAPAAEPTRP